MAFRSISGSKIIGQGQPQAVPIQLDPAPYKGSIAYGTDGRVYVSNGLAWADVGSGNTGAQGIQGVQGVQGVQGTYGPGFDVIGSVADVDNGGDPQVTLDTAFPAAAIGQGVIDEADDELWVYNGTDWVNVGSFRGVQGFTGNQGVQGDQGDQGDEGIQGYRGYRGLQGNQGAQGAQGVQGEYGFQGTQGLQGPQAFQGVQGVQGFTGNQGIQGLQGPQAFQGVQGVQGDFGIQGTQGTEGTRDYTVTNNGSSNYLVDGVDQPTLHLIRGFSYNFNLSVSGHPFYIKTAATTGAGDQYNNGVTNNGAETGTIKVQLPYDAPSALYYQCSIHGGMGGLINVSDLGPQGVQGPQAFQGVQGTQGVQGVQGFTGNQGIQGIQGTQGFQGTQGTQGFQGFIGLQGTQGFQGLQGVQGFYGTTGLQGIQGIQGLQGLQGAVGHYGGLTHEFDFVSNITASTDPGLSGWKLNTNNITTATVLTIDDIPLNNYGNEIDETFDWLAAIPGDSKGLIVIESFDDGIGPGGHHQVVYEFSNFTWDSSGSKNYGWFDVTYVGQYGITSTSWATDVIGGGHGPKTIINFVPRGDGGAQGVQGTQGFQGFIGLQGDAGNYGGASFPYVFNADTSPTGPATGRLKLNNTDVSIATIMRINDLDAAGNDLSDWFDSMNTDANPIKGYIKVISIDDPNEWLLYTLTGTGTTASTHNLFVTFISKTANADATYFTANPGVIFTFSKSGSTGAQGIQGPQAFQGLQGTQGVQGITGAGEQGLQGYYGWQGTQGVQGFPGPIGPQGVQGVQGDTGEGFQGSTGSFGGVTFDYTWSTDVTVSDPGVGYLKVNNAAIPSTTVLVIDDRDDNFVDIQPFLRTIDDSTSPIKGHFKVSEKSNPSNFAIFAINSLNEPAGYFEISCAHVSGTLSGSFANDADVVITFARTGDIGPGGPQGVQGVQGDYGIQGNDGGVGGLGIQGVQGFQGFDGAQGTDGFIGGDGLQGYTGFQGTQGIQGDAGTDGDGGFQGPQGVQGFQGFDGTGAQGVQGNQGFAGIGATGIQGFQGFDGLGFQGVQGVQGNDGPVGFGLQGLQGFTGDTGEEGPEGPEGVQGSTGIGEGGIQGVQGIDGDSVQGVQGDTGIGEGGVQGVQGTIGIGDEGFQGTQGFIGAQGIDGDLGAGGTQGVQGVQGDYGIQGIDGSVGEYGFQGLIGLQGFDGLQGDVGAGEQGDQGVQGVQGDYGIQGYIGGGVQGLRGFQAFQGTQGIIGFQGLQGTQGFGPEGSITNIQNVHETSVQDTALFITMVEGGSTTQPLRSTTGPNPGGESNFFYTSNVDELTVENIQVEGNLTVVGTMTAGAVAGVSSDFHLPNNVDLTMGNTEAAPYAKFGYNSTSNFLELVVNDTAASQFKMIDNVAADQFAFNMVSGDFTAAGNVGSNSDARLKENVETISNALDKVALLRGVYFDLIAKPGNRNVGLIAQEVEEVLPEVVSTSEEGDKIKSVAYANVVGLLVEAIKELKGNVDKLKN